MNKITDQGPNNSSLCMWVALKPLQRTDLAEIARGLNAAIPQTVMSQGTLSFGKNYQLQIQQDNSGEAKTVIVFRRPVIDDSTYEATRKVDSVLHKAYLTSVFGPYLSENYDHAFSIFKSQQVREGA